MTDLALKLVAAVPLVRQTLIAKLRQGGLRYSLPQLQILALVRECPRTVSELAELQGVTKATMSATISRLAHQGLIDRRHAADDRRQVVVTLTPNGQAVRDEASRRSEALVDEMLACLTGEEKHVLMLGLELLTSAFQRAREASR